MSNRPVKMGDYHWYPLLVVFAVQTIALMLVVGFMIRLNHKAVEEANENDRKWCTLLVQMDDAYRLSPPTTPAGQNIAAAIHQRRVDLGC